MRNTGNQKKGKVIANETQVKDKFYYESTKLFTKSIVH